MSSKEVKVSDRAILRYAERVMGLDIEDIRGRLREAASFAATLGNCKIPIGECVLVVKNNTVVTIVDKLKKPQNKKRRNRKLRDENVLSLDFTVESSLQ